MYVYRSHPQPVHPKTMTELRQKYESKQASSTDEDTQNCLDDYYRIYPAEKNASPPGYLRLPPPCPGIPQ